MPLARIITEHAEEALELAIQLRARGFEVETVAPSQVPETPADLEVQLDACDRNDALARVLGTSPDEDLHIFVAPGALDESYSAQPSVFVPPPYKRPRSESSPKLVEFAPQVPTANPENPQGHLWRTPVVGVASTRAEPELAEPVVARLQIEEVEAEPVRAEIVHAEIVESDPVQAEAVQDEIVRAEPVQAEMKAGFVHAEPVRTESVQAEPVRAESIEAEPVGIAGQLASAVDVAPEAQLSEVETGATLTVFESPEAPAPATGLREFTPASVTAAPGEVAPPIRRRADPLFWRTAIAAAALAALVVVVGSAWQRQHPAAGTLPTSGAQQIPFQSAPAPKSAPASVSSAKPSAPSSSVTAPPSAVATGASPSSTGTAQTVTPAQPHPVAASPQVVPPPSNPQPHQVAAKKPPAKKKPAPAQHHAAAHTGDSGLIAKDTVVYYNRKGPAAPANPSAKQ